jgi:flagellar basal body rod protein FlgG
MKKIYFVIIVIALFLVFGYGCSNSNSVPMTVENFEFAANTDGKSYYVSKYKMANDRLVYIPDQFNGYPVTSIGSNAFYNNSAIEKIIVPKTIETIYSSAFSGVENLREIEFEEDSNLISIGENAFSGCKNLLEIHSKQCHKYRKFCILVVAVVYNRLHCHF